MRILVTGGAGFIGSHLVDALVERGHEVVIYDSLDPQVHGNGKPPAYLNRNARFLQGDVRDHAGLKAALEGAEIVFHEASAVGVGQSQYEIARYVGVNTLGTANLLDLLANGKTRVRKLIVAASMSTYGEGLYGCRECGPVRPPLRSAPERTRAGSWEPACPGCGRTVAPLPTPEAAALYPNSIYSLSKRDQEEMCLLIGGTYGIPVVSLRYFNVYGPRQSLSNPYTGVAAIFLSRIKNDRPPVLYEDGLQTRDFVSVHDVVKANLLAMERDEANGQILNVGTGRPVTIRAVAETLARVLGKAIGPEITFRFRKGDVRHCFADPARISTVLGFQPEVSFQDGVRDLVHWSRAVAAEDRFEQAREELEARGLV
ncbi:MAG: SDR family NAD(P)-dependent oxidoreductase [bacterium]